MTDTEKVLIKKRNGEYVEFDENRIDIAITKAMNEVGFVDTPDKWGRRKAEMIASQILDIACHATDGGRDPITVEEVERLTFELMIEEGELDRVARAYESYRAVQEFRRKENTIDRALEKLLNNSDEETKYENSNKNINLISTKRDYTSAVVSEDLARRKMIPEHIIKAHDEGEIHLHDLGNFIDFSINCCVWNLKDMLDNGTVMNGTMIEKPSTFSTACTILTQAAMNIISNQFGGNSVNIKHLGEYLKRSEDKYKKLFGFIQNSADRKQAIQAALNKDLQDGVQILQYQVITTQNCQGQVPFSTIFLELDERDEYIDYTAKVYEEIIKQRYKGVKNEAGQYYSPSFPKIIYVLDENNMDGGRFNWLTKQAVECSSKRLVPDYVSGPMMRKYYGDVIPIMG